MLAQCQQDPPFVHVLRLASAGLFFWRDRAAIMGRPTIFTPELADQICELIVQGKSLRRICAQDDMPGTSTVCRWLAENEHFREQYARAREAQADTLADEILDIADDGTNDWYVDGSGVERVNAEVIARSRLRVDTRKWIASKLKPKKYGEKSTTEHTGPDGGAIPIAVSVNFVNAAG